MVEPSKSAVKAVDSFQKIKEFFLFEGQGNSSKMNLYIPRINSREFDMNILQEKLMEVVVDFALSRSIIRKYKQNEEYARMTKEARERFRSYTSNKGELGELLLYVFLEGDLKAPQILSKMSLKTSSEDYVKKSDGIHYLKIPDSNRYHIIFCEAKMYKQLSRAFKEAFKSISIHKEDTIYEKSLISYQIGNEFIDEDDKLLIKSILYPSESKAEIRVSNAFGIFIGFEINDEEGKTKTEDDYETWLKEKIVENVQSKIKTIENYITEYSLVGSNFYVYLMPFTDLDNTRTFLTKKVTE